MSTLVIDTELYNFAANILAKAIQVKDSRVCRVGYHIGYHLKDIDKVTHLLKRMIVANYVAYDVRYPDQPETTSKEIAEIYTEAMKISSDYNGKELTQLELVRLFKFVECWIYNTDDVAQDLQDEVNDLLSIIAKEVVNTLPSYHTMKWGSIGDYENPVKVGC